MNPNLPNAPMSVIKVFLVEDYAPILERLAQLVVSVAGVEIVGTADHADEAVAGIKSSQPDVVIVDLQLRSGTSGLSVLKWQRQHAPGIAVVVLSNAVYPQMKQACLDLGARLVLDKATEALHVREAIREIARSRQTQASASA